MHRLRLQASPQFVQALAFDGRAYVLQEAEPYAQYWLSERERVLLSLFSTRGGRTEDSALQGWLRLQDRAPSTAETQRVRRAVAGMLAAGVLMPAGGETSRYSRRQARDYIAHRPYPAEVAAHVVKAAAIGPRTRVLDIAGGPGDLALALARHSREVSMLELSRGFVATARQRARAAGLPLRVLHDSANRLPQRDEPCDVVTVSQALHWLDDVQVCRGVVRLLQRDGSFFVIHAAMDLPDAHPLAWLLGHDSVLGAKVRRSFADEVQPLARRLAGLFDALEAPEVDRVAALRTQGDAAQRIGLAGTTLFRQTRPFGEGYARGFLTPRHIAVSGLGEAAFWARVQASCEGRVAAEMNGTLHWAVLHFRRGAAVALPDFGALPATPIGYEPTAA